MIGAHDLLSVEDAAREVMDVLGEIAGIAHVIDRALYHEHAADHDLVRLAALGVLRLAELAGDHAADLHERLKTPVVKS